MAFLTIVLIFCSLLFGCSANIIWDNNYNPNLNSEFSTTQGYFLPYISNGFALFDDFQLQEDVTSLTMQVLVGTISDSIGTSVSYSLYNDNNGIVGNLIMSSTSNIVAAKTGKKIYDYYPEWSICFAMSGISLSRQTTYWLKVITNDANQPFAQMFPASIKKLNAGYQIYDSNGQVYNVGDFNFRLSNDWAQCPQSATVTTSPMTSAQMTTSQLTSAEMTTAPMTTAQMTTSQMTTAKMTTAAMTTGRVTSQALTTGSYSQFVIRFTSNFVGEVVLQQPFSSSGITFMLNARTDRNIYIGRTLYITRTPYYSNPALIGCKFNARYVFAKATTIDGVSWYFPDTTFQFMTTKYYYYLEPLATVPVICS
uniref:Predicted protein n=1 Tax=Hordeum vulgare subsp. vulgare TaxID=112509 RepID=F2DND9_HORVV|nr:predicted protein [Hordeum vulgare subsp. vulgare]